MTDKPFSLLRKRRKIGKRIAPPPLAGDNRDKPLGEAVKSA